MRGSARSAAALVEFAAEVVNHLGEFVNVGAEVVNHVGEFGVARGVALGVFAVFACAALQMPGHHFGFVVEVSGQFVAAGGFKMLGGLAEVHDPAFGGFEFVVPGTLAMLGVLPGMKLGTFGMKSGTFRLTGMDGRSRAVHFTPIGVFAFSLFGGFAAAFAHLLNDALAVFAMLLGFAFTNFRLRPFAAFLALTRFLVGTEGGGEKDGCGGDGRENETGVHIRESGQQVEWVRVFGDFSASAAASSSQLATIFRRLAPQTGQRPRMERRPFFNWTSTGANISRVVLHLSQ